ncbi:MAG: hypothetical protein WED04_10260 [Promethearchaeati archaeon SRVP18_Atabeyarchaeia-1]
MKIEQLNLPPCLLITFLGATLVQATMIWQLIVVAGVVGGMLAKDFKTAILSGVLGFISTWLLFLGLIDLSAPGSFGLAFSFFSMFFVIGVVLIAIFGAASASLGYFLMRVIGEARSTNKRKR